MTTAVLHIYSHVKYDKHAAGTRCFIMIGLDLQELKKVARYKYLRTWNANILEMIGMAVREQP